MDPNPEKIVIGIAELVVVHNPAILITIGLGHAWRSQFVIR